MQNYLCWGICYAAKKPLPPAEKLRHAMECYRYRRGHDATHALINGSLIRDIPDPPLTLVEHAIPSHTLFLCIVEAT